MKNILFIFLILFTNSIFAQSFKETTFETQHVPTVALDNKTEWLFFSTTKDGADILHKTFTKLKVNQNWLEKNKAIYVADIHGMPKIISLMFALPKMASFPFHVALDRTGKISENWQNRGNYVTLYQVKELQMIEAFHFDNSDSIKQFILKNF